MQSLGARDGRRLLGEEVPLDNILAFLVLLAFLERKHVGPSDLDLTLFAPNGLDRMSACHHFGILLRSVAQIISAEDVKNISNLLFK